MATMTSPASPPTIDALKSVLFPAAIPGMQSPAHLTLSHLKGVLTAMSTALVMPQSACNATKTITLGHKEGVISRFLHLADLL